jgi:hypothetical protein
LLASGALLFNLGEEQEDPSDKRATNAEEIVLLSSNRPGSSPFTSSAAQPPPTSSVEGPVPLNSDSSSVQSSGSTEGIYAGVRGTPSCEAQQLGMFLKASPDKAIAWAAASRIAAADISPYLDALTPALVRADTKVTDYGLVAGRPLGRQAVIQSGTAVLLDRTGVPRVRCVSGNPLAPPGALRGAEGYTGSRWPEFRPDSALEVVAASDPLPAIILFDLASGQSFARIPGSVVLIDIDRPQPGSDLKVVEPGQESTVTGTAWPRGTPLTVSFDNPEIMLAEADADEAGNFTVEVVIPDQAAPGIHQIAILGGGFTVNQTVYVTPRSVRAAPA